MYAHCRKWNLINDLMNIQESSLLPLMGSINSNVNDLVAMENEKKPKLAIKVKEEENCLKIEPKGASYIMDNELNWEENFDSNQIQNNQMQLQLQNNENTKTHEEKKWDYELLISLALYKNCQVEGNDENFGTSNQRKLVKIVSEMYFKNISKLLEVHTNSS